MTRPKTNDRSAPADEHVRTEWLRRIEAEYHSAAHTQHLTLWLIQLGAPPGLLQIGLRIVADELAHAELSAAVYQAAGGSRPPTLHRDSLRLERTPNQSLEHDVLRVGVEQFCLGETIAVRLFNRLRRNAKQPTARAALDRILRDEVVHRDFGWTLLEWLLSTPAAPIFREQLQGQLPAMLARVRNNYGGWALEKLGTEAIAARDALLSPAAREWGVMPLGDYVATVEEAYARDYAPRFAELGIRV